MRHNASFAVSAKWNGCSCLRQRQTSPLSNGDGLFMGKTRPGLDV
jgi:hypothetical protein